MKKYIVKGFTLIELLVVIAIIGILSAVVLASLNSARSKGSDAGIKSNLHTVETQSSIFASNNNEVYGVFDDGSGNAATCPTPGEAGTTVFHDATIANAIAAALKDAGGGGTAVCLANDTAYAAAVSRPADGTSPTAYWCVDKEGNHCGVDSNALTGVSCGTCVSPD